MKLQNRYGDVWHEISRYNKQAKTPLVSVICPPWHQKVIKRYTRQIISLFYWY